MIANNKYPTKEFMKSLAYEINQVKSPSANRFFYTNITTPDENPNQKEYVLEVTDILNNMYVIFQEGEDVIDFYVTYIDKSDYTEHNFIERIISIVFLYIFNNCPGSIIFKSNIVELIRKVTDTSKLNDFEIFNFIEEIEKPNIDKIDKNFERVESFIEDMIDEYFGENDEEE